jgi:hypothetical protein
MAAALSSRSSARVARASACPLVARHLAAAKGRARGKCELLLDFDAASSTEVNAPPRIAWGVVISERESGAELQTISCRPEPDLSFEPFEAEYTAALGAVRAAAKLVDQYPLSISRVLLRGRCETVISQLSGERLTRCAVLGPMRQEVLGVLDASFKGRYEVQHVPAALTRRAQEMAARALELGSSFGPPDEQAVRRLCKPGSEARPPGEGEGAGAGVASGERQLGLINQVQRLKKAELVAECARRGLPSKGTKPVLIERLVEALGLVPARAKRSAEPHLAVHRLCKPDSEAQPPDESEGASAGAAYEGRQLGSITHVRRLKKTELMVECAQRGLPWNGTQPELVERLVEALGLIPARTKRGAELQL